MKNKGVKQLKIYTDSNLKQNPLTAKQPNKIKLVVDEHKSSRNNPNVLSTKKRSSNSIHTVNTKYLSNNKHDEQMLSRNNGNKKILNNVSASIDLFMLKNPNNFFSSSSYSVNTVQLYQKKQLCIYL